MIKAKLEMFNNTHVIKEYTANSIAKKLDLDRNTVVKYCKILSLEYKETTWNRKSVKKRSVLFKGIWYESIVAASKATGVHRNTIEYHASDIIKKKYAEDFRKNKTKVYEQSYFSKTQNWAKTVYDCIEDRIRTNPRYKDLFSNIILEEIECLLKEASGTCFVCLESFPEQVAGVDIHDRPFPDRINTTIGYTKENVRIVCNLCNVNHKVDLYTKKCTGCSSWILHNSAYCHLCGVKSSPITFEENWELFKVYRQDILKLNKIPNERRVELYNRLVKAKSVIKGTTIPLKNTGIEVINSFMPNMYKAYKSNLRSWFDILQNEDQMKSLIENLTEKKIRVTKTSIKKEIRSTLRVADVYNFRPMAAKTLYELFVPNKGLIYDFSSGYGGRLFGAMSSNNEVNYIGVEPNTETLKIYKKQRIS